MFGIIYIYQRTKEIYKKERSEKVGRAKRPYEGTEAYEAGRRDAIKDLYDEVAKIGECFILSKDIMEYLRQKIYSNNA